MSENMDSANRKTRLKQLLDMGTEIRKNNEDEDNEIVKQITNIIKETDCMNSIGDVKDRAHNTTEVVMDAHVVQMSHELIGQVMQKMASNEFEDEEWINAINAMVYKNGIEDWNPIAEISTSISKMFKFSPCLLINCDYRANAEGKIVKERQRKYNSNKGEEVRPENLSQIEQKESNAENMTTIYKQILKLFIQNKQEPIPFYKLIIDPNNFMNSIDNSFQIAFLARDNSIKIAFDSDGLPNIRPLNKSEKSNASNETIQAICSLDMKIFKKMIRKYNITEPILRRRN